MDPDDLKKKFKFDALSGIPTGNFFDIQGEIEKVQQAHIAETVKELNNKILKDLDHVPAESKVDRTETSVLSTIANKYGTSFTKEQLEKFITDVNNTPVSFQVATDAQVMSVDYGSYGTVESLSIEEVMRKTNSGDIIKALLKKQGRWIKDGDIKTVLQYLTRKSYSLYAEPKGVDETPSSNPEEMLARLKNKLEEIPGVKVTPIMNMYPETVSIIVKVDLDALDEDEMEMVSTKIVQTLRLYKPKGLDELEVIYHNKEVY